LTYGPLPDEDRTTNEPLRAREPKIQTFLKRIYPMLELSPLVARKSAGGQSGQGTDRHHPHSSHPETVMGSGDIYRVQPQCPAVTKEAKKGRLGVESQSVDNCYIKCFHFSHTHVPMTKYFYIKVSVHLSPK
jgi:hypothetical protein